MSHDHDKLYSDYPWLKVSTTLEEYVEPDYYDQLLKPYVFDGLTDLDYLRRFVRDSAWPSGPSGIEALELGCGTGRATQVALDEMAFSRLDLVDLSDRMLREVQRRFSGYGFVEYVNSDAIIYLERTDQTYDFVFSLWSLSHSVHEHLKQPGGDIRVRRAIEKFFMRNMRQGAKLFLIHFDSLSDEQRILMRQWRKLYPLYNEIDRQSPSKRLLDRVLKNLEEKDIINLNVKHYLGEPIEYGSSEEAMEIFMNLHLESTFNSLDTMVAGVVEELKDYLEGFADGDGVIKVTPGCFVYEASKR